MCLTMGSRRMIHSPMPSSAVPSQEEKKTPAHACGWVEAGEESGTPHVVVTTGRCVCQ